MCCCAFTGHRPAKLPYLRDPNDAQYRRLFSVIQEVCIAQIDAGATEFVSGMALGVDMLAAEVVLILRKTYPGISLVCALPSRDQAANWPESESKRHAAILLQANEIISIRETYAKYAFLERDRYMVNRCDTLIAVYNGSAGGTMYTVECARHAGREIVRIDPATFAITHEGGQIRFSI